MTTLPPVDFQTVLVNPDGTPTEFFMNAWQALMNLRLTDLEDTNIDTPLNGEVLTYDGTESKWIAL